MKVPNLGPGYLQPHVPRELRDHYDKYLETPQWRILRRKVYKRAKMRCELCYGYKSKEPRIARAVHHTTYDRLFFERLTDLLAVCFTCHAVLHPGNDALAEQTTKDEPWKDPRLEAIEWKS